MLLCIARSTAKFPSSASYQRCWVRAGFQQRLRDVVGCEPRRRRLQRLGPMARKVVAPEIARRGAEWRRPFSRKSLKTETRPAGLDSSTRVAQIVKVDRWSINL